MPDSPPPFWDELTNEERQQVEGLTDEERDNLTAIFTANVEAKDKTHALKVVSESLDNRRQQPDHQAEANQTKPPRAETARTNTAALEGQQPTELTDEELLEELTDEERQQWDDLTNEEQAAILRKIAPKPDKPTQLKRQLRRLRQKGKAPNPDEAEAQERVRRQHNRPANDQRQPEPEPPKADRQALLKAQLKKATTTADVLDVLDRLEWYERTGAERPSDQVPLTEADLCDWIANAPQEARTKAAERLAAILPFTSILPFIREQYDDPNPSPVWWWVPRLDPPHLFASLIYKNSFSYGVLDAERIHAKWRSMPAADRPPHPLAPLVEAWQAQPKRVEADTRKRGIAPAVLKHATLREGEADHSPDREQLPLALNTDGIGEIQDELPFLETPKQGQLVPVLPLILYDRAGGSLKKRGKGAPIALRLFFEAQMYAKRESRSPYQSGEILVELSQLVSWIWPNGWQRHRDLPALAWALKDVGELRIEWERRLWNLVVARTLPTWDTRLKDPIVFHVFNLPGSDHGPLIDRNQLRQWGLQSAPAYRAFLRLAYLWDDVKAKRGSRRVYATRPEVRRDSQRRLVDAQDRLILERGKPATNWNHPRAVQTGRLERNPDADKVPMLGPEDLALLGFDDNPKLSRQQIANRAKQTRAALKKMETAGAVILEADRHGGTRILEPAPPAQ